MVDFSQGFEEEQPAVIRQHSNQPTADKFLSEAWWTDAPFPKPYFEETMNSSMEDTMGVNDRCEETAWE